MTTFQRPKTIGVIEMFKFKIGLHLHVGTAPVSPRRQAGLKNPTVFIRYEHSFASFRNMIMASLQAGAISITNKIKRGNKNVIL